MKYLRLALPLLLLASCAPKAVIVTPKVNIRRIDPEGVGKEVVAAKTAVHEIVAAGLQERDAGLRVKFSADKLIGGIDKAAELATDEMREAFVTLQRYALDLSNTIADLQRLQKLSDAKESIAIATIERLEAENTKLGKAVASQDVEIDLDTVRDEVMDEGVIEGQDARDKLLAQYAAVERLKKHRWVLGGAVVLLLLWIFRKPIFLILV
jgi:hypothetical protein